jgi:hypothetical protein
LTPLLLQLFLLSYIAVAAAAALWKTMPTAAAPELHCVCALFVAAVPRKGTSM